MPVARIGSNSGPAHSVPFKPELAPKGGGANVDAMPNMNVPQHTKRTAPTDEKHAVIWHASRCCFACDGRGTLSRDADDGAAGLQDKASADDDVALMTTISGATLLVVEGILVPGRRRPRNKCDVLSDQLRLRHSSDGCVDGRCHEVFRSCVCAPPTPHTSHSRESSETTHRCGLGGALGCAHAEGE